jgi:hypothetical protein
MTQRLNGRLSVRKPTGDGQSAYSMAPWLIDDSPATPASILNIAGHGVLSPNTRVG